MTKTANLADATAPIRPHDSHADVHPVLIAHRAERAADAQLRIADAITKFAGTMMFVYIHAVVFALWMLFLEKSRGRH
jgi:uncharacterized membrane protein